MKAIRFPCWIALFLAIPSLARGQAALYDVDPFVDSSKLGLHINDLLSLGGQIDEIGVTPDRNWIVISNQGVTSSSGFPAACENKVNEFLGFGWIIDAVAFTQDGKGWVVVGNNGLDYSGIVPNIGVLYPLILDTIALGGRVKDLTFMPDGWVLVTTGGGLLGYGVPADLWNAMIDLAPAQRTACQVSMDPDGAWILVADDWFASDGVSPWCVNAAMFFQQEELQMDRVAICSGGGYIHYSQNAYTPPADYLGQLEYGIEPDKNIWDLMREYQVPGMSIAYIRNWQVEWARGYGELEFGTQRAAYTTDLFDMASVSKGLSSIAILGLLEGSPGLLTLDTSAWEVASAGPIINPLKIWLFGGLSLLPLVDSETLLWSPGYTLRRLLSHTASLDPGTGTVLYPGDELPSTSAKLRGWSTGNKYRARRSVRSDGKIPGTGYSYSGGGFLVAEAMAEVVTGQDFRDYFDSTLVSWLGLENTSPLGLSDPLFAGRTAVPHVKLTPVKPEKRGIYTWTAAGGVAASPSDVARAVICVMNFGWHPEGTSKVLEPWIVQEMLTDQTPDATTYGLGLNLSAATVTANNGEYFAHTGSHADAKSRMAGNPTSGVGLVIAINAGHDEAEELRELIYKDFRGYHGW